MMPFDPSSGAAAPDCVSVPAALAMRGCARDKVAQWQPGLARQPLHSEIFASADEASGAGLALALARDALGARDALACEDTCAQDDRRQILWVQDRHAIRLSGRPYLHGLPADLRHRVIHVAAKTPEDALFAIEEGLKCRDLACVIGEMVGNPRALTFVTSRRLSLAAERAKIALWLVRLNAAPDLSSARMRWQVSPAVSSPPRWDAAAPGAAQWRAELFRARGHAPGEWMLSDDREGLRAARLVTEPAGTPDHGAMAGESGARSLAAG